MFSKSFDDEPLEETIDDNSEMFVGGVCAYAQAVVSGIEDKHEEIDEIIASHLKKRAGLFQEFQSRRLLFFALQSMR